MFNLIKTLRRSICDQQNQTIKTITRSYSKDSTIDVSQLRKPYNSSKDIIKQKSLENKNPFEVFDEWMKLACKTPEIEEPTAMCLATVSKNNMPTARMVLLKGYNENEGFSFYTNSRSIKGRNITSNPYAALVFYWEKLNRSIRIEGEVKQLSNRTIDEYFKTRPKSSQLAAHVSQYQSSAIKSRQVLQDRFEALEKLYCSEDELPRPEFWVGYSVIPTRLEFWQGQSTRMHDRIAFTKKISLSDNCEKYTEGVDGWFHARLEP